MATVKLAKDTKSTRGQRDQPARPTALLEPTRERVEAALAQLQKAVSLDDQRQAVKVFNAELDVVLRVRYNARFLHLLETIAGHPALPKKWQRHFVARQDGEFGTIIAQRRDAPPNLLKRLARSDDQSIFEACASNPSTPIDVLERLINRGCGGMIAANPAFPTGRDSRIDALRRRRFEAETITNLEELRALLESDEPLVIAGVRSNPAAAPVLEAHDRSRDALLEARLSATPTDELEYKDFIRASQCVGVSTEALERWLASPRRWRQRGGGIRAETVGELGLMKHFLRGSAAEVFEAWLCAHQLLHHAPTPVTRTPKPTPVVVTPAPPARERGWFDWINYDREREERLSEWARSDELYMVREAARVVPWEQRAKPFSARERAELEDLIEQVNAVYRFAEAESPPRDALLNVEDFSVSNFTSVAKAAQRYVQALHDRVVQQTTLARAVARMQVLRAGMKHPYLWTYQPTMPHRATGRWLERLRSRSEAPLNVHHAVVFAGVAERLANAPDRAPSASFRWGEPPIQWWQAYRTIYPSYSDFGAEILRLEMLEYLLEYSQPNLRDKLQLSITQVKSRLLSGKVKGGLTAWYAVHPILKVFDLDPDGQRFQEQIAEGFEMLRRNTLIGSSKSS